MSEQLSELLATKLMGWQILDLGVDVRTTGHAGRSDFGLDGDEDLFDSGLLHLRLGEQERLEQ